MSMEVPSEGQLPEYKLTQYENIEQSLNSDIQMIRSLRSSLPKSNKDFNSFGQIAGRIVRDLSLVEGFMSSNSSKIADKQKLVTKLNEVKTELGKVVGSKYMLGLASFKEFTYDSELDGLLETIKKVQEQIDPLLQMNVPRKVPLPPGPPPRKPVPKPTPKAPPKQSESSSSSSSSSPINQSQSRLAPPPGAPKAPPKPSESSSSSQPGSKSRPAPPPGAPKQERLQKKEKENPSQNITSAMAAHLEKNIRKPGAPLPGGQLGNEIKRQHGEK